MTIKEMIQSKKTLIRLKKAGIKTADVISVGESFNQS